MEHMVLPDTKLTLLTGATGMLGQEILCQWLESQHPTRLVVLARDKGSILASQRIHAILSHRFGEEKLGQMLASVIVLNGDVSRERLGLAPQLYQELAERTEHVIHSAAGVRFDQPLEQARNINVEGTRQVLELARAARRAGREGRVDHVSTAYVAGKRRGVVYEHNYEHTKGFHNTYEQSKYEAEGLVREAMQELPTTIFRPSIIVGHSQTGETSDFKAFYWPLRVYAQGQLRLLPGKSECRIDLIPVDFVASALLYLAQQPYTVSGCYHLSAGPDNLPTLLEILNAAVEFFRVKAPHILNPIWLKMVEGKPGELLMDDRTIKTFRRGAPYYPYFATDLIFDNHEAALLLRPAGIKAPPVRDFFDRLFRYCLETDWGHRPLEAGSAKTMAVSV